MLSDSFEKIVNLLRINMNVPALITGLLGVALYLLCFQLKDAKAIIACKLVSSILYVVQYFLLSAFVGAAMDAAAFFGSYFAYKKDTAFIKKYKIPVIFLTVAVILTAGIVLYENPISILPIAGVLFETWASWMEKERMIRIVSLLAVPCWLVYNFVSGAYGSAVGSVLALISILVALVRYSKSEKGKA